MCRSLNFWSTADRPWCGTHAVAILTVVGDARSSRPSGGQPIRLAIAGRLKITRVAEQVIDRLESSPDSKVVKNVMAQDR